MKINYFKLASSLFLCLAVGGVGSIYTVSAIPIWYFHLNKPFFSPPNWIFGPVWTILYILMGVSFYLIWNINGHKKIKQKAIVIFLIQLLFNFLWSIIFFGFRNPPAALIEIVMLLASIIFTIREFKKLNNSAATLLYPYLAWVSFASVLNLFIVLLN